MFLDIAMVLGGGTDTHMFYVQGGCQVAIMGRGCRIGLKKCIGVHWGALQIPRL